VVKEWQGSHHAYAMVDPVFRGLVAVRQAGDGGESVMFCVQCHSAVATRGGEVRPGFDFTALSPVAREGVTCEACHRVTQVARTSNSGHILDPKAPIGGPFDDAVENPFHTSRGSEMFESPEFCAGCHNVVEVNGLPLERPYDEWLESPAAAAGKTCQDCHMPERREKVTADGPERTVHNHRIVGVDVPSTVTGAEAVALDAEIQTLLSGVATMAIGTVPKAAEPGQRLDVILSVKNEVDGHALPTGSAFLREFWVHLTVTDAEGRVLYETGALDANGDLKGPFSALEPYADAGLIQLGSRLLDETGTPTIFPWLAVEMPSTAIPAGHTRTYTLFVPVPEAAAGPLSVEASLNFRPTPPHVQRALGMTPVTTVRKLVHAEATVPVNQ
jgi:hypothetical protein